MHVLPEVGASLMRLRIASVYNASINNFFIIFIFIEISKYPSNAFYYKKTTIKIQKTSLKPAHEILFLRAL